MRLKKNLYNGLLNLVWIFGAITYANTSSGQIGASIYYGSLSAGNWQDKAEGTLIDLSKISGYEIGIDGNFKLANYRVEFFPELRYGNYTFNKDHTYKIGTYGAFLNTRFYVLDMIRECNECPTFSNKSRFFQKSFFLFVSPGVRFFDLPTFSPTIDKPDTKAKLALGVGLGMDFVLADAITLSPTVGYSLSFQHDWTGLTQMLSSTPTQPGELDAVKSDVGDFNLGLRIGYDFGVKPTKAKRRRR